MTGSYEEKSWTKYAKQAGLGLLMAGVTAFGIGAENPGDRPDIPSKAGSKIAESETETIRYMDDFNNDNTADFLAMEDDGLSHDITVIYKDSTGGWNMDQPDPQSSADSPGFEGLYALDVDNDGDRDFLTKPYRNEEGKEESVLYLQEDDHIEKEVLNSKDDLQKYPNPGKPTPIQHVEPSWKDV